MSEVLASIDNVANIVATKLMNNTPIICIGNGGSLSIAEHLSADLQRGGDDRACPPTKVILMPSDLTSLSMWANDIGWDNALTALIRPWLKERPIIVIISNSGGSNDISKNIVNVATEAKLQGLTVISFTGQPESPLAKLSNYVFDTSKSFSQNGHTWSTNVEITASKYTQYFSSYILNRIGIRQELSEC